MSEMLVIEWDAECLRALELQAAGNSVTVRHVVEVHQPQGQDPAALTTQFKAKLAEKQVKATQVIVTLPRESVVIRRLELPDVSDAELPVMVRFQAAAKSSLSLDELALDFLPLPRRPGASGREVLLAMVSQTMVRAIREFVTNIGKELTAITLSPVGSTELAARVPELSDVDAQGAVLLIARHGERVEISLLHQKQLIFSHGARVVSTDPAQINSVILTEISRGLMSFQNLNLGLKLTHAVLLGLPGEFAGLKELLAARYPLQTRVLDPFAIVKAQDSVPAEITSHSAYAGLLGSALSRTQPFVAVINFLDPRKPPVVPNRVLERRRTIGIVVGGLVAIVLVGYFMRLSQLNSEIAALEGQIGALTASVKQGKPTVEAAQTVQDWADTNVNWLETVAQFQTRLPSAERIYLTRLNADGPVNKQPAKLVVEGHAREQKDIREWRETLLVADSGYQLQPRQIEQMTKEYYPWRVSEEILLNPVNSKPKTPAKTSAAPPAKADEKVTPKPTEQPVKNTTDKPAPKTAKSAAAPAGVESPKAKTP